MKLRPLAGADAKAGRLLTNPERRARLVDALINATVYRPLRFDELDLGVYPDGDPQAVTAALYRLTLNSVREDPEGRLILSIEAVADLLLDLAIAKADFYEVEDDLPDIRVTNPDLNDRYLSAETEAEARITWNVVTDANARRTDVEVAAVQPVDDDDILSEWLAAGATDTLTDSLETNVGWQLHNYRPEGLNSIADEATVASLHTDDVSIYEVDSRDREK